MTLLIGVVKGPTIEAALSQIQKAAPYADVLELRLDYFDLAALDHLSSLPRKHPFLFTLRKRSQGGQREMEESERLALFEKLLLAHRPAYCDIEADTELAFFERILRQCPGIRVIASFHDFENMPSDLETQLEHMQKPGVTLYKIAIKASSTPDCLRCLIFDREHPNVACIAMGELGQPSRILAPLVSSPFVYASVEDEPTLVGQLSLKTLSEIYRFKQLNPQTRIYALLGDPVDKSIGHLFHNKTFPSNAVYVKLRVDTPELSLFFSLMRRLPFSGFSVTMPLKELLGKYLYRLDPAAAASGAVNTIAMEGGRLIGYNTDGAGALVAIEKKMGVKGKRMTILGAGGSARAIAYEATQRKAKVTLLNRTPERAQLAAHALGCESGSLDKIADYPCDILVNTIPEPMQYDLSFLKPSSLVMDIVYWEKETPLLKAAQASGLPCIHGEEMYAEQGLLQQKIWFEK